MEEAYSNLGLTNALSLKAFGQCLRFSHRNPSILYAAPLILLSIWQSHLSLSVIVTPRYLVLVTALRVVGHSSDTDTLKKKYKGHSTRGRNACHTVFGHI